MKRIRKDDKEIRIADKAGRDPLIIPHFSCHIFRHTFCTWLCECGPNIKVVQSVMGHSDIQTTLGIYAEVNSGMTADAFDRLTRSLGKYAV